jgi:hypothetical protein
MDIVETIQTGGRRYQDGLTLDYRDWPVLIKDVGQRGCGLPRAHELTCVLVPSVSAVQLPSK